MFALQKSLPLLIRMKRSKTLIVLFLSVPCQEKLEWNVKTFWQLMSKFSKSKEKLWKRMPRKLPRYILEVQIIISVTPKG